jgi:outer membrane murein-binding lipoprotein Lpp
MNWVTRQFSTLASYIVGSISEAERWVRKGDDFWKFVILTAVIFVAFYLLPAEFPNRVRWAGTILEFMGVAAVWISIERVRSLFGKPSVFRSGLMWLGELRFIFLHHRTVNLEGVGLAAGIGSAVAVALQVHRAPKSTEERVDQLEKDMQELRANIGKVDQKVDQQKQELRAEIEKEAAARLAGEQGVSKKLEEGVIGDSPLELAGVVYVCLGLVMAHLSDEVARVLSWLGLS